MQFANVFRILLCCVQVSGFLISTRSRVKYSGMKSTADDTDFMSSLRSRIEQVHDRETKIPLVVMDSMLPRQTLKVQISNPVFMELIGKLLKEETPSFGMLGMGRLKTGEKVYLKSGVLVNVHNVSVKDDSIRLELQATERFRLSGEIDDAPEGWTEGRIVFLDSGEEDAKGKEEDNSSFLRAMSSAGKLDTLVKTWIALARENERAPGQIDDLLVGLGKIPPVDEPSERAFWIGALVNPIPAMGVALEIRPGLLTSKRAEDRINIALNAIEKSIKHMEGSERLF